MEDLKGLNYNKLNEEEKKNIDAYFYNGLIDLKDDFLLEFDHYMSEVFLNKFKNLSLNDQVFNPLVIRLSKDTNLFNKYIALIINMSIIEYNSKLKELSESNLKLLYNYAFHNMTNTDFDSPNEVMVKDQFLMAMINTRNIAKEYAYLISNYIIKKKAYINDLTINIFEYTKKDTFNEIKENLIIFAYSLGILYNKLKYFRSNYSKSIIINLFRDIKTFTDPYVLERIIDIYYNLGECCVEFEPSLIKMRSEKIINRKGIYQLILTSIHESIHALQLKQKYDYTVMGNQTLREALIIEKSKSFYSKYHDGFTVEVDASKSSSDEFNSMMKEYNVTNIKRLKRKLESSCNNAKLYRIIYRDIITDEVDRLLKDSTFDENPIVNTTLELEYHSNGERKSLEEVLKEREIYLNKIQDESTYQNINLLYNEIIRRSIHKTTQSDLSNIVYINPNYASILLNVIDCYEKEESYILEQDNIELYGMEIKLFISNIYDKLSDNKNCYKTYKETIYHAQKTLSLI